MCDTPSLRSPPIEEALLDLRVRRKSGVTAGVFEGLADNPPEDFPIVELQRVFEGEVEVDSEKIRHAPSQERIGAYRIATEDRRKFAQFHPDRFTFNILGSYRSWEELEEEALAMWDVYRRLASPESIVRLTTRFINRIRLPEAGELEDYVMGAPSLPEGLEEWIMRGFVNRVTLTPPGKSNPGGNVTQQFEVDEDRNLSLILDIEVFRQFEDSGEINASAERETLRPWLNELRELKNRIFFSSLTDAVLDQYR